MRVVVAPDKFRGTATAAEICAAVASVCAAKSWDCRQIPMADGGEGTLDALGGPNQTRTVSGPLGDAVNAEWRLKGPTAVIEMARASGLALVAEEARDPLAASTFGTGELISHAVDRGARRIVLGVGGSATTDGGLGALRAMEPLQRYRGIELIVACDVETMFLDAAQVFGPQKGASPAQVKLLRGRLERLAQMYLDEHDVDVTTIRRAGAAGGLAGGLAAIGADLVGGFDVVADETAIADALLDCDLVVTGEGKIDDQTFAGKVVGGIADLAAEVDVPVLAIGGMVELSVSRPPGVTVVSLTDEFGADESLAAPAKCVALVVESRAADLVSGASSPEL